MRQTIAATTLLLVASVAVAGDAPWSADWDAAREKARKDQKPLICVTLAPG